MEENVYANGKIYRIFVPGLEDFCYIGCTVTSLSKRLAQHKDTAKSDRQYKFASAPMFSEDNKPVIELIELFPCASKQELLAKETEIMKLYPDRINKVVSFLTEEERVLHDKETMNTYCKTDKGKETRKKCKKEWDEKNKEHVTLYNEVNKEHIRTREKTYLHAMSGEEKKQHLEKRKQNKHIEITCKVCNAVITKGQKWRHDKSHL